MVTDDDAHGVAGAEVARGEGVREDGGLNDAPVDGVNNKDALVVSEVEAEGDTLW